jgi:two-component system, chemotaxis family, chemotaxis protein CheY
MPINKNMPILIVDDYKTMLRIVRGLLNQLGFSNIEEATDGQMAWDMVKSKPPYGMIISDWNMEPMSGFEFLKLVRGTETTKTIPFIMVTAESKTENIIAAKQAGVSNYIVKPFNAQTLKQKIEAVFGAF